VFSDIIYYRPVDHNKQVSEVILQKSASPSCGGKCIHLLHVLGRHILNYHTASDAPCHTHATPKLAVHVISRLPHNQPCWCQLWSTNFDYHRFDDIAYSPASAPSLTWITVLDEQIFGSKSSVPETARSVKKTQF